MLAVEPDCLVFAEDGKFIKAGRTPARVLESLMGGQQGAGDLQALLSLPAQFAVTRFLAECLLEPTVVGPDTRDPQTNQILQALAKLALERARPIRVVDLGAGVGRLLASLRASVGGEDLIDFCDYHAVEPNSANHIALEREILHSYANNERRIFRDEHELCTHLDTKSVDCIVMCNVFHEISPDEWPSLFLADGALMSCLSDDGFLLIVEDYGLPIGERAHRFGFLLLDEPEFARLFDVKEADRTSLRFVRTSAPDEKYSKRLVAHLVHKSCATRVTSATRCIAIKSLNDRSRKFITDCMQSPLNSEDASSGRAYAKNAQL
ncbi:MAG: methyltransferase, partial [Solirubrobacteraceae bacterium]|nr:methyltransferase [Solirubrobacteraceae bacterium]